MQPDEESVRFDLDRRLNSVLRIHSRIPEDAFTASALGTERSGSGVVISERGIVLTVGYLGNEAEQIWMTTTSGHVVEGHMLGYDFATGFALLQALGPLECPAMPMGSSASVRIGADLVLAAGVGRECALRTRLVGKREFAGYWEYLLDEAFFIMPAHPAWGGAALMDGAGALVGIGSLLVQVGKDESSTEDSNMIIPIDLLKPIQDDLARRGQSDAPRRPWLGVFCSETRNGVTVVSIAHGGPADKAGIEEGDILIAVGTVPVGDLAEFYRELWAFGDAGVTVEFGILREGRREQVSVVTAAREEFMRRPPLH